MKSTITQARIYCGTYAKCNNGSIAGAWLDLSDKDDKVAFLAARAELHSGEGDPEFIFQDFEEFPRRLYNERFLPEALWDWLALDDADHELLAATSTPGQPPMIAPSTVLARRSLAASLNCLSTSIWRTTPRTAKPRPK